MSLIRSLFAGGKDDPAGDREPQRADDLALYHSPSCGFCLRVLRVVHQLNVALELRDTTANPDCRRELVAGAGRSQVPCLRIDRGDQPPEWMYESGRIVDYLRERFG